jgi:hypothetical protein
MSYSLVILACAFVTQVDPAASVVLHDIKVTLLDARRLSFEEYRDARKPASAPWAGGGFRFVFLVENRPGAALPPALGEVRVVIGSEPYNSVTNATSRKPFAPLIVIRAASDFFATTHGSRAALPLRGRRQRLPSWKCLFQGRRSHVERPV